VASLSFVSIKAFAKTRAAIANTTASALRIVVELLEVLGIGVENERIVNSCDFERANAVRAVAGLHGQTHSEVVVAVADIIDATSSVSTATVVASSVGRHSK